MASTAKEWLPPTSVAGWTNKQLSERIRYTKLGQTDIYTSCLGFGCAQLSRNAVFNDDNSECIAGYQEAVRTVELAVSRGINYFDTAPFYGHGKSEVILGKALEGIPRSSYYLATKVGRNPDCTFDYSAQNALQSVENSLRKLKVDCIDLIQVHDVEFADSTDIIINETLPALEVLRQRQKVKYIGITGYSLKILKEIVSKSNTKIDTVLSYCRCTPFDDTLLQYLPFFKERGLGVINAALLGMGLLTDGPLPHWHVAGDDLRNGCKSAALFCKDRGIEISKLAVHYALTHNNIETHLIGIENTDMLERNLDVAQNGIRPHEESVLQEIRGKFFAQIKENNWEGIEVARYQADPQAFIKFLKDGK